MRHSVSPLAAVPTSMVDAVHVRSALWVQSESWQAPTWPAGDVERLVGEPRNVAQWFAPWSPTVIAGAWQDTSALNVHPLTEHWWMGVRSRFTVAMRGACPARTGSR